MVRNIITNSKLNDIETIYQVKDVVYSAFRFNNSTLYLHLKSNYYNESAYFIIQPRFTGNRLTSMFVNLKIRDKSKFSTCITAFDVANMLKQL